MPIKELTVSFKINVDTFARMLAAGHEEMNINVYSNEPRVSHTKQIGNRGGVKQLVLSALRDNGKMKLSDIRLLIAGAGYSPKTLNGQMHGLLKHKLVRHVGPAMYAITEKGRAL